MFLTRISAFTPFLPGMAGISKCGLDEKVSYSLHLLPVRKEKRGLVVLVSGRFEVAVPIGTQGGDECAPA